MAILLETSFSTDENVVAQVYVRLFGKAVESLVVEFDQEKLEEFLSSSSASPKAMRQYRNVSSETCFRISSEITLEVTRTSGHNTNDATSEEVLKTSRVAHATIVDVSQETRG